MPQLNLASEVYRAQVVARRRRLLYGVSSVLVLLILVAWGLPVFLASRVRGNIARVESETAQLEAQLQAKRDAVRPLVVFLRRLDLLKEHLAGHYGWSRVLAELERLLPPDATFQDLVGSTDDGSITAHILVPSVDAAADVVASLQAVEGVNDTPFRRVEVDDLALPENVSGGSYLLSLKLSVARDLFSLAVGTPAVPPAGAPAPAP